MHNYFDWSFNFHSFPVFIFLPSNKISLILYFPPTLLFLFSLSLHSLPACLPKSSNKERNRGGRKGGNDKPTGGFIVILGPLSFPPVLFPLPSLPPSLSLRFYHHPPPLSLSLSPPFLLQFPFSLPNRYWPLTITLYSKKPLLISIPFNNNNNNNVAYIYNQFVVPLTDININKGRTLLMKKLKIKPIPSESEDSCDNGIPLRPDKWNIHTCNDDEGNKPQRSFPWGPFPVLSPRAPQRTSYIHIHTYIIYILYTPCQKRWRGPSNWREYGGGE